MSALWGRVWYENYSEPDFVWQSSSASSDFEAKMSLTPLMFGTLKGCFYALIFAVPMALGAAVFTGFFMNKAQRAWVKPTIESLEALPTVILGFLAGLWLAPWVQDNLLSVLLIPLCLVLSAMAMVLISRSPWWRNPKGLHAVAWAVVPLSLTLIAAFALSPWVEQALFAGDLAAWLEEHAGINYEQRNALVIGIAMGLAIMPTIFAIAEDAIHGVPQHLVHGSLALGASPTQTLNRVVLPTASAGMFSAVIIGLGRAAGETMVVLMATGNTPIISSSLFDSFRTLSANIAIEMPESAVGSTHFRVLFLAALVLFLLTFAFNTIAEVVRQRLRQRYRQL